MFSIFIILYASIINETNGFINNILFSNMFL